MTYEHILLDREDGVGIVTLNRPEALNAIKKKHGFKGFHLVGQPRRFLWRRFEDQLIVNLQSHSRLQSALA